MKHREGMSGPDLRAFVNPVILPVFLLLLFLAAPAPAGAQGARNPEVKLLAPQGGEVIQGGAPFEIKWTAAADGGGPVAITLDFSPDGGRSWSEIRANLANSGSFFWPVPTESGERYRVRISARDTAGLEGVAECATDFAVDALRPLARVNGPSISKHVPVRLNYEARDFGRAGIASLELWFRLVGEKAWRRYAEYEGAEPVVDFEAADGTYALVLTAIDKAGNRTDPPDALTEPQLELVVDTGVPRLDLRAPAGGEFIRGGFDYTIRWRAEDPHLVRDFLTLELSADGGANWEPIAKNVPNTGSFTWHVPQQNGDRYRIRIAATDQAGNRTETASRQNFAIDSGVPTISVCPPAAISTHRLTLVPEVFKDTGPAGLKCWEIWTTTDDGAHWRLAQTVDAKAPGADLTFADGTCGLWFVAVDRAGNRNPAPEDGSRPQRTLTVRTETPTFTASGLTDGASFRGGERVVLAWQTSEQGLPPRPVSLLLSGDAGRTWKALVENEAPTGRANLTLPNQSGEYVLKVVCRDAAGLEAVVAYKILVDATPPHVRLTSFNEGGQFAGGTKLQVTWEANDANLDDKPIDLLFSKDQGQSWIFVERGLANSGSYLWTCPKVTARTCLLKVSARDRVGNQAEEVSARPFAILSDAVKPTLVAPAVARTRQFGLAVKFGPGEDQGIDFVELWVSRDRGAHWAFAAKVEPAQFANVPLDLGDGLYAFAPVTVDVLKNRSPEPAPGENGDLVVLVDTQKPEVAITTPKPDEAFKGRAEVNIEWVANDANLGDTPVTVELAEVEPGGKRLPFREVGARLPRVGSARTRLPDRAGDFAVRVRAVDRADNEGSAEVVIHAVGALPVVALMDLGSIVFKGGAPIELHWKTDAPAGALTDEPITIQFSTTKGAEWATLVEKMRDTGTYVFTCPMINNDRCLLKVIATDKVGNKSEAVKGPFAITSEVPLVLCLNQGFSKQHSVEVTYQTKPGAISPLDKIEIYASPDDGKTWQLKATQTRAGEEIGKSALLELEDGAWLLYCRGYDLAGNAMPDPQGNKGNLGRVTVDTKPPTFELHEVADGAYRPPGTGIVFSWDVKDENPLPKACVSVDGSIDGGKTWRALAHQLAPSDKYHGTLPGTVDTIIYRLTAVDAAGNTGTREFTLNLKAVPLAVEVKAGVEEGKCYRGGDPVPFTWKINQGPDLESKPVSILAHVGDEPWSVVAQQLDRAGTFTWTLPHKSGDKAAVKVIAAGIDGQPMTLLPAVTFALDDDPPATIVHGPIVSRTPACKIPYEIKDIGPAGPATVELWFTANRGERWVKGETFRADGKPIPFTVPGDGSYGIYLVATDAVDNATPAPAAGTPPQAEVIVDGKPPTVALRNFLGGETYLGGAALFVHWEASDENLRPDPITLEVSADSGASWQPLAARIENKGRFLWRLPMVTAATFRLRVTAEDQVGNTASAASLKDFTIDASVAAATPKPIAPTAARQVKVEYGVTEAGSAKVAKVTLFVTQDGGETWKAGATVTPPQPLDLPLEREGEYGIFLVVENSLGARMPEPQPKSPPQELIVVDRTPPVVRLKGAPDGVVAGGARREVSYEATDLHLAEKPISLELSRDDGQHWETLAADQPNAGTLAFDVPRESLKARLRVSARDAAGNVGSSEPSGIFSVDSDVPSAKIVDVGRATGDEVEIRYTASKPAAELAWVKLWLLREGSRTWTLYGEDEKKQSPFRVKLSEGRYGLWLEVADRVGNVSAGTPAPGTPPPTTYLVDWTAPQVVLKSEIPATARGGAKLDLAWVATDDHLGPHPIAVEVSKEGDTGWKKLVGEVANGGRLAVELPRENGRFRLRVTATDEAGNVGVSEPSAPFTLDATPPSVELTGTEMILGEGLDVAFTTAEHGAAVGWVKLWVQREGGREWEACGQADAGAGPIRAKLPPGRYGLYLQVADVAGNATKAPAAADRPMKELLVDWTIPAVVLDLPVEKPGATAGRGEYDLPYRVGAGGGVSKLTRVTLWVSRDGAKTWTAAGGVAPGEPLTFTAPEEGRYDLWLVAENEAGTRSAAPQAGCTPMQVLRVIKSAPVLRLLGAPEGTLPGGGKAEVAWEATSKFLGERPIDLEISRDDGATWLAAATGLPNSGRAAIELPRASGNAWRVRVRATDEGGNAALSEASAAFAVDADPPQITHLEIDRSHQPDSFLRYTVSDLASGVAWVRLYARPDRTTAWQDLGVAESLGAPIPLNLPEGRYWLWLTAADKVGNATRPPAATDEGLLWVTIDRTPPVVRLRSLQGGDLLPGGAPVEIVWEATDDHLAANPINLRYSVDEGRTWSELRSGLPNTGRAMINLPKETTEGFRLLVEAVDEAGNVGQARSPASSKLDALAPECIPLGPRDSTTEQVLIQQLSRDRGPAGMARVDLYVTTDDGRTWLKASSVTDVASPIRFEGGNGRYGVALVGVDRVGNMGPAPRGRDSIQMVLDIQTNPIPVELRRLRNGGQIRAGEPTVLQWYCGERDLADRPVSLEFSVDGGKTWATIVERTPNSGRFNWIPPRVRSDDCILRVSVLGQTGRRGFAQSEQPFSIKGGAEGPDEVEPVPGTPPGGRPPVSPQTPTATPKDAAARRSAAFEGALQKGDDAYGRRDYEAAGSAYREAVMIAEESGKAWHRLGKALYLATRIPEAEEALDQAARLAPETVEYLNDLGVCLLNQNQPEKMARALRLFNTSLRYGETATVRHHLGTYHYKAGNFAEAINQFRRALDLDPARRKTRLYLGQAYQAAGRFQEAMLEYETIIRQDVKSVEGQQALQLREQVKAELQRK